MSTENLYYNSGRNGDGSGFYSHEGRAIYVRSREPSYGTNWKEKYIVDGWVTTDKEESKLGLAIIQVDIKTLRPRKAPEVATFFSHIKTRSEAAMSALTSALIRGQREIKSSVEIWEERVRERNSKKRENRLPWPPPECRL
ncbi:MAG: hypothetical protein AAB355_02225 [Patescibacteria group bacterium]